jgi:5'-nucleotidase
MNKKIVFVDMDRVLCDYESYYFQKLKESPEIIHPQSQDNFFFNLPPILEGIEGTKILMENYDVYILTAPSYKNPRCYIEKRLWIEKYFGLDFCEKLIICRFKGLLKGDYLIDDRIHEGFEGDHIHFATTKFPNWETVLGYLKG